MLTGESVPIEAGAGFETYAGALVRQGEAVAEIVATGSRTKFGRSAELIRTAHVESSEQKAIVRVVRSLALFNGGVIALLITYAVHIAMPLAQIAPLVLVAVLASIPVALPSMFTLAATVGARAVARRGVLPTRLSALDEAAGMDVLCVDKTGTLTRNELAVSEGRLSTALLDECEARVEHQQECDRRCLSVFTQHQLQKDRGLEHPRHRRPHLAKGSADRMLHHILNCVRPVGRETATGLVARQAGCGIRRYSSHRFLLGL